MPELQEREDLLSPHSHSDSEDGGRPGSPEEGLGSPQELKSEQPAEAGERVGSLNCPESKATAVLSSRELWQLFDTIGTEMIVTRRGRWVVVHLLSLCVCVCVSGGVDVKYSINFACSMLPQAAVFIIGIASEPLALYVAPGCSVHHRYCQ